MLKRVYHIVTVFVLILGTSGITITQHYCHGKLISSGIYSQAKSCCDSSCGACENKTTIHRIQDDFVQSSALTSEITVLQIFNFNLVVSSINSFCIEFTPFQFILLKAPPPPVYSILPEYLKIFRC